MYMQMGVISLFVATVLYGLYGTYSRLIGIDFGVFTQNWARNLIVLLLISIVLFIKRLWKPIQKKDIPWMLAWILSGTGSVVGIFIAFNKIPIGTAYFIFYAGMILAGLTVGFLVYKERLTLEKILSAVLSIMGLLLIFSVYIKVDTLSWLSLSFGSGIASGLWTTFSKKISHTYPNTQLVWIDAFSGFIISLCIAFLLQEHMPPTSLSVSWLGVGLFAISQVATTSLVVYGFKHTEAQIGTLILPLEAVFGAVFAYFFFHEVLLSTTIIGGLFIFAASIVPNIVTKRTA